MTRGEFEAMLDRMSRDGRISGGAEMRIHEAVDALVAAAVAAERERIDRIMAAEQASWERCAENASGRTRDDMVEIVGVVRRLRGRAGAKPTCTRTTRDK